MISFKILLYAVASVVAASFLFLLILSLLPLKDQFKYPVAEDGTMLLAHEVSIHTSPQRVWAFLSALDHNYRKWHPQDHILFRWTGGTPLTQGATFYSEQMMFGGLVRYRGTVLESIPEQKVVMGFAFPVSIVSSQIQWEIHEIGNRTVFRATTTMKLNKIFRRLMKSQIERMIEEHDRHVAAEAENLKTTLEQERGNEE